MADRICRVGICLFVLFVSLACGASGEESTPNGADSLLAAVKRDWRSRANLRARFAQEQVFAGFDEPLKSRGVLEILRPRYFALRFDPPHRQLQVCDGRSVWTYMEDQQQVFKAPLSPDATRGADLLVWALEGATAIGAAADTTWGITSTRLDLAPGPNLSFVDLCVWVAADRHEILGYAASDFEGNRTRLRLLEIAAAPDLDASDFEFHPPEGVEIIPVGGVE